MATYRCNDCGNSIFSGDGLAGSLQLLCQNRYCISRRQKPPKRQTFVFGTPGAPTGTGSGQKALRGVNRRAAR